jgi:hypothetical protein
MTNSSSGSELTKFLDRKQTLVEHTFSCSSSSTAMYLSSEVLWGSGPSLPERLIWWNPFPVHSNFLLNSETALKYFLFFLALFLFPLLVYVSSLCTCIVHVPDPGKGVCADTVNRGAILEGGGPGPPGGNKERQLSPDKGGGKTWQNEKTTGSQGRRPLHGFKMPACTE